MLKLVPLLLLLPLAGPVYAQTAPTDPAVKPVKEKKICRREIATGSMMAKNVCHSKAEWAALDQTNDAKIDNFKNGLNQGSAGPTR